MKFRASHRLPGSYSLLDNSELAHAVWRNQYRKVGIATGISGPVLEMGSPSKWGSSVTIRKARGLLPDCHSGAIGQCFVCEQVPGVFPATKPASANKNRRDSRPGRENKSIWCPKAALLEA